MKPVGGQFEGFGNPGRAYYHGTASGLKGDMVEPRVPSIYRGDSVRSDPSLAAPRAYATTNVGEAARVAGTQAIDEGRLFGSVYEVEPRVVVGTDGDDKYGVPSPTGAMGHIADPEGLDVIKHTGFVKRNGDPL